MNDHSLFLYALSTCGWCKKTKQLLNDLSLDFDYVDVDLLKNGQQEAVVADMERWNSNGSFPTLVVDDRYSIRGFQPEQISELKRST